MSFDAKTVQADLILLGYLPLKADDGIWGDKSKRAIRRLKRRAKTLYRIHADTGKPADASGSDLFLGNVDDTVLKPTLDEIQKWKTKKWKAPLGRFALKKIAHGTLREDAADAWTKLTGDAKGLGATLEGPYGDTKRGLKKQSKPGASSYSFHIVGRAVDINQGFTLSPARYRIAKDVVGGDTLWRIYCKTDKQDGTQGTKHAKGTLECWDFSGKKLYKAPEGHYVDLTATIQNGGKFERIKAQSGWEGSYNKTEWWHFQYKLDKQETFQDECELIGITEKDLTNAGYTDAQKDHAPG